MEVEYARGELNISRSIHSPVRIYPYIYFAWINFLGNNWSSLPLGRAIICLLSPDDKSWENIMSLHATCFCYWRSVIFHEPMSIDGQKKLKKI